MDLEKIKKLVKTDCYGEKDEIINEAVLICLETSCSEEKAVKLAFKKFKREFWDKKFNYASPIIDDDGEDLRDNYIFVDKGEEETFNRLDDNLRERGKKLCETACLLGKLGVLVDTLLFIPDKAYCNKQGLTYKSLNNKCNTYLNDLVTPINSSKKSGNRRNVLLLNQKMYRLRRKNNEQIRRNERNVIQANGTLEQN